MFSLIIFILISILGVKILKSLNFVFKEKECMREKNNHADFFYCLNKFLNLILKLILISILFAFFFKPNILFNNFFSKQKDFFKFGNISIDKDSIKVGSDISITDDEVKVGSIFVTSDKIKVGDSIEVSKDCIVIGAYKIVENNVFYKEKLVYCHFSKFNNGISEINDKLNIKNLTIDQDVVFLNNVKQELKDFKILNLQYDDKADQFFIKK